jgi:hypothetical protein
MLVALLHELELDVVPFSLVPEVRGSLVLTFIRNGPLNWTVSDFVVSFQASRTISLWIWWATIEK